MCTRYVTYVVKKKYCQEIETCEPKEKRNF